MLFSEWITKLILLWTYNTATPSPFYTRFFTAQVIVGRGVDSNDQASRDA